MASTLLRVMGVPVHGRCESEVHTPLILILWTGEHVGTSSLMCSESWELDIIGHAVELKITV
jgi:hypothetical protein